MTANLSVRVGCSLKRVGGAAALFGITVKLLLSPVFPLSAAVTLRPVSALKAVTDALETPFTHEAKPP
jgi:hypothetical protein